MSMCLRLALMTVCLGGVAACGDEAAGSSDARNLDAGQEAGSGGVGGASAGVSGSGGASGGAAASGAGGANAGGWAGAAGAAGAVVQGACGGDVPPDFEQYCTGVDRLSLSNAQIVDLDEDGAVSPGDMIDITVTLTNAGDYISPRVGLLTTRDDVAVVGDNPYPPFFSMGPGSAQVVAGEARLGGSIESGTVIGLIACVTGPYVDCPNGDRLEFSVTVR